ncbi:MAG: anti-sigma factor [Actinobacteria bacterium]|nr:anti-sigma factor [Actinomycetota bacterium]
MRRKLAAAAVLTVMALTAATVAVAQGGSGTIRDDKARSDKVSVSLREFPKLPANQAYKGWLVSDDGSKKLSLGLIAVDDAGGGKADFTSPSGENLVGAYDKLVLTIEPVPDADPNPAAAVAAQDMLPPGALVHIRHLL